MSAEERLSFYENKDLPGDRLRDLHRRHHLNFNLDWKILRPAISMAIRAIRDSKPIVSLQQPGAPLSAEPLKR